MESVSKDGGRTGIFDRPAFVLQPTLGNTKPWILGKLGPPAVAVQFS